MSNIFEFFLQVFLEYFLMVLNFQRMDQNILQEIEDPLKNFLITHESSMLTQQLK